jgi:hypothetical protein
MIEAGRRRRIARGAGVEAVEVNKFIRDFEQCREMMRAVGSVGVMGRVLGLVTEDRTRRDPSFVYWNWSRHWGVVWVVVAAALLMMMWGRHWRGGGW